MNESRAIELIARLIVNDIRIGIVNVETVEKKAVLFKMKDRVKFARLDDIAVIKWK